MITHRVQVPHYHILSKIVTYTTTIRNLSTQVLGPLDPQGLVIRDQGLGFRLGGSTLELTGIGLRGLSIFQGIRAPLR